PATDSQSLRPDRGTRHAILRRPKQRALRCVRRARLGGGDLGGPASDPARGGRYGLCLARHAADAGQAMGATTHRRRARKRQLSARDHWLLILENMTAKVVVSLLSQASLFGGVPANDLEACAAAFEKCARLRATTTQFKSIALLPLELRFFQGKLSQLLGASRHKVNAAMGLLECEGLVRILCNHGKPAAIARPGLDG